MYYVDLGESFPASLQKSAWALQSLPALHVHFALVSGTALHENWSFDVMHVQKYDADNSPLSFTAKHLTVLGLFEIALSKLRAEKKNKNIYWVIGICEHLIGNLIEILEQPS